MPEKLFPYLPKEKIVAAFEKSPGNEFASGKFASPESSAALAANTFGLFIDRPGDLPAIPGTEELGWPAAYVGVEECAPFPWWPRGRHPWLDVLVETSTHVIGIESKRYEPYRTKQAGKFSKTYWRPVWGDNMGPIERTRDRLSKGDLKFERLDAVQLVKHAFGLRTEGHRRRKSSALVYLFAEPETWPDGKPISAEAMKAHASEAERFATEVDGAEVALRICTYRGLLETFQESPSGDIRDHSIQVQQTFNPL